MPEETDASGGKAARDLWERTLAQVPTAFGRIVYLASLRNSNSGRYEHFGLAQVYSQEVADWAIRSSHASSFSQWLNYLLPEQKRDVEEYLFSLEDDRETILKTWASLSPYRNLLPTGAGEAEKQLFVSDLELILRLLGNELSPCGPTRAA